MTSTQLTSSSSSSTPSSLSSLRSMACRQLLGENVIPRPKPVGFPIYGSCSSNTLTGTKDVGDTPLLLKKPQQHHSHSPLTISHSPRVQNLKATPVLSIAHAHVHAETSSSASLLSASSSSRIPDTLVSLIPFPVSVQQQPQQASSSLCRLASEREPEDPDACSTLCQDKEFAAPTASTSSSSSQTAPAPSTNTSYAHPLLPRRRAQSGFTPSVLPPAHHHRAKRARISSAASGIPRRRLSSTSSSSPSSSTSTSSSLSYSASGTGTGSARKRLPATDMELLASVYRTIVWHDLSESAMDIDEEYGEDGDDAVFVNARRRRELSMLSRSLAERLHTTLTERKCRPALLRMDTAVAGAGAASSSSSIGVNEEALARLVAKLLLRYRDRSTMRTGRMGASSPSSVATSGDRRKGATATVRASSPLSSSST